MNNQILKIFNNPFIFFPSYNQDIETNTDSIIKYGIYVSIIICILTKNWKLIILISICLVILKLISSSIIKINKQSLVDNLKPTCRKSTIDNPMGNTLLYTDVSNMDYILCPNQEKLINNNLNYNVYKDSNNLYNKHSNNRTNLGQFITMPSQSNPNNINDFFNYLYYFGNKNCKIDSIGCIFNNDLKYHKNEYLSNI
jgi:hypothetical protein